MTLCFRYSYFPLGGAGTAPAADAGPVAEIQLPADAGLRSVSIVIINHQ